MENPILHPIKFIRELGSPAKEQEVEITERVGKRERGISWDSIPEDYNGVYESVKVARPDDYLKAAKSWVYACVNAIADDVASIEFKLYSVKPSGDMKEIFDHDLLNLLYRVNPFTTKFDHIHLTQQYLELAGEAPWLLDRTAGVPTGIYLLRPDRLTPKFDAKGLLSGYKYKKDDGTESAFDAEDIIFLKYSNPAKPMRGKGTLEALRTTIAIDDNAERYNESFFRNSAIPDFVLKTEKTLDAPEIARITERWEKKYRGTEAAHKVSVLQKGMTAEKLQMTSKDMDFLEQQKFTRDKILSIFRVPKTIIAITDDVNRANAETADYVFAKRTIKPKMERIIEQLNEFLVPLFGDNLWLDFEDPVPENLEAKLSRYNSALANGWMTTNEIRQEEGKDPVDGGDEILKPFNFTPLGAVNNPTPADNTAGKMILRKIGNRGKEAKVVHDEIRKIVKDFLIGKIKSKKAKKKEEKPLTREEQFWYKQTGLSEKFELRFIKILRKLFNVQRLAVLRKLEGKAINPDDYLFDVDETATTFSVSLKPLIRGIIKEEGNLALELVGVKDQIDMTVARIIKYLNETPIKFSTEVAKTTNDGIRDAIATGVGEGEGIGKIAKRINDLFDGYETSRAKMIARTETSRSTNFATDEGYKQSGVVTGKQWLTAMDERTDEECADMDGKIVEIDDEFLQEGDTIGGLTLDYGDIEYPPLHNNCRCTIIPIIGSKSVKVQINKEQITKEIVDEAKKEIAIEKEKELGKIKRFRKKLVKEVKETNQDGGQK